MNRLELYRQLNEPDKTYIKTMSNFICDKCGAEIIDSPLGYVTGCEHYPVENCRFFYNCKNIHLVND